ncbi:uncharacterized protein N7459_005637 [Penicillium hispanicum]|uniref:uncharacterized protein n=1 Tax=Penicillium hispanicum TaxID=1080232 RepID=UPI002540A5E1|nr:uncharacterized protein N7459_005637 [Penicillium hispanicum]KAJ5579652.1 hypothetical protein N7459_005637 [Penicillium hispanicum]
MYGLKQIALLSCLLLSVSASASASKDAKRTMVGIETEKASRALNVPLDDCHEVEEEEVLTVSVRKHCRVFTGPECTGRNTLLTPGDHSNKDPVPIESIYCHGKRP